MLNTKIKDQHAVSDRTVDGFAGPRPYAHDADENTFLHDEAATSGDKITIPKHFHQVADGDPHAAVIVKRHYQIINIISKPRRASVTVLFSATFIRKKQL